MKKLLILVPFMFLLYGCETTVKNFQPDAALLVQCEPMSKVEGSNDTVTLGDLLLSDVELAGQYKECSERVSGWIRSYEEYSK